MSVYSDLRAAGHSPAKAREIMLDAERGDWFSKQWIKVCCDTDGRATIRRAVISLANRSDLPLAKDVGRG